MWRSRLVVVAAIAGSLACGGEVVAPETAVPDAAAHERTEVQRLRDAVYEVDEALIRLQTLAEAGDAQAQISLASSYANMRSLRDPVQSAKWYLAAARQGLAGAQTGIGGAYLRGSGVEKDVEKGLFWLRLGADQGMWLAAGSLGDHYRGERWDEPRDFVQAYRWYSVGLKIAERNERDAIIEIIQKRRDQIAGRMTAEQIAEGERLAADWVQRDWSELQSRLDELG